MRSKLLVGVLLFGSQAFLDLAQADFFPGNLVIYRVGIGSSPLTDSSTAVFLDEYTPTGVKVQSVAMPTSTVGSNRALTASGIDISEGLLTRSTDGTYLVLTGYAAAPGKSDIAETDTSGSGSALRVVGLVNSSEVINTSTTTTRFDEGTIRSAVFDPAANAGNGAIWMTGSSDGVVFTTVGASGAGTQVSTTVSNLRQANVFSGQLYTSTRTDPVSVGKVGTGEPIAPSPPTTNLPGIPTSNDSPYAFFFADLSAAVAGLDTLYVASDNAKALTKFSLVGGTWVSNGTVGNDDHNYHGLTGSVIGQTVSLFATRDLTDGDDKDDDSDEGDQFSQFVSLVDTSGYNGTFSTSPIVRATAASKTAFRGIAFAPVPEPGAIVFGGMAGGVLCLAAAGRRLVGRVGTLRNCSGNSRNSLSSANRC